MGVWTGAERALQILEGERRGGWGTALWELAYRVEENYERKKRKDKNQPRALWPKLDCIYKPNYRMPIYQKGKESRELLIPTPPSIFWLNGQKGFGTPVQCRPAIQPTWCHSLRWSPSTWHISLSDSSLLFLCGPSPLPHPASLLAQPPM